MESYPPELSYSNIQPKGFYSTFKEWTIEPLASGGVFWPGQNVKILIQSIISGVMDPYRSHLQFEVQIDSTLLPVGLLQVDSSAQSFIEQLVINSKNRQIERIPQYSVLAAWLTDCGLAQMYAQGRQTEGLGYSNIQSMTNYSKPSQNNSSAIGPQYSATATSGLGLQPITGSGTIFPTQSSGEFFTKFFSGPEATSKSGLYPNMKGHITGANSAYLHKDLELLSHSDGSVKKVMTKLIQDRGYVRNMRAQYVENVQSNTYTDSTTSIPSYQVNLKPGIQVQSKVDSQWTGGLKYEVQVPEAVWYNMNFSKNAGTPNIGGKMIPNTTATHGFTNLYSPNFCKGVREPFISGTVPQCQMRNGKILPTKIPIVKRTFKVPIISAILGLLIPQDQFVLLPIKALNQILMEFVIDKYAMFTSGYSDIGQYDLAGMKTMQQRAFCIKRVFYKMHTYQFYDPQIDQYLSTSLSSRILLNVNMWTLGNQYQVIKGQNLNNTWPVACTSQALNEIVVLFYPLDYQRYSFCRKHFRLSNNITKFQLRINMDYFPSQPLLGNGGNPCMIQGSDNSAFIEQIFWSNNFMFNKVNPWPRINAYNFAINDRCYDPSNEATFYDQKIITDEGSYNWNAKSVNQDTALGMPWIHQNRFVGKAGYVFGFQPYAHSAYHLTGLDCRQVRQFDVLLNTHPIDNFQREQTMYIFTRSSCIVEFSNDGVLVYGR